MYAREMRVTFRTSCREMLREQGSMAFGRLLVHTFYDLFLTAGQEQLHSCFLLLKRLSGIENELPTLEHLFTLEAAFQTDVGRTRSSNEDNALSVIPEDRQVFTEKGALFVVADGLGGHSHGDLASQLTVLHQTRG